MVEVQMKMFLVALILVLSLISTSSVAETNDSPSVAPVPKNECEASGSCPVTSLMNIEEKVKTDAFLKWMEDNGAFISKSLEWPHYFSTMHPVKKERGVLHAQFVKREEILVRIPRKLILSISSEVRKRYDIITDKFQNLLDGNENAFSRLRQIDIFLALTLLEESRKQNASFFAPYLAVLPKLDEIFRPETFDAAQFALFDDPAVSMSVRSGMTRLKSCFDVLVAQNLLAESDFDDFSWAYYIVRSRAIPNVESTGGGKAAATAPSTSLVPFADMFNVADSYGQTAFRTMTQGHIEIKSAIDVSEGQALLFHGPFSNLFLLVNKGYASEDNTADGYPILVHGFPPRDPLIQAKEKIWNASRTNPQNAILLYPTRSSTELLGYFRLLVTRTAENVKSEAMKDPFLDAKEEMIALLGCVKWLELEMERYRTTLEEDEKDLKRDDVVWSQEKLVALKYRISRKRIVQRSLCYFKSMHGKISKLSEHPDGSHVETYLSVYEQASNEAYEECYL